MKNLITAGSLLLVLGTVSVAHAQNETDTEKVLTHIQPDPAQGNIIIRVDNKTHAIAIMTAPELKTEADAQQVAKNEAAFKALDTSKMRTELDNDGATSSWYHHRGYGFGIAFGYGYPGYAYGGYPYSYGYPYNYDYGYVPTYYYGGSPYLPYYSYGYGGANYYYYGRGGGWGGYGRGYGGGRGGYGGIGHGGGRGGHH